ncbi:uncharacterized protein LOC123558824 [Mercenaria mercenaria]|uniref:uncharacterized protein LOC123558824 n=1 Tax=Mercenaria mercenaria TaxID=6596 RepID=UPI00234E41A2|nr:uncharacterized protein LOC123558824 [Mercenaria mercenaria]
MRKMNYFRHTEDRQREREEEKERQTCYMDTEDTTVDHETVKDLIEELGFIRISEAENQSSDFFGRFIRDECQPYSPIQWLEIISRWMFDDERSEIVDEKKRFAFHVMFEVYVAAWFDCKPAFTGTVKRVGKPGDNGADILAIEQNPNTRPIIVQVKHGKSTGKNIQSTIRDLVGSCVLHEVKRGFLAVSLSKTLLDPHGSLESFERKGYSITILYKENLSSVAEEDAEQFIDLSSVAEEDAEQFIRFFIKHVPKSWKLQLRQ